LPPHGEFQAMIENDSKFSPRTGQRLNGKAMFLWLVGNRSNGKFFAAR
jgi:hypothetical protein